MSEIPGLKQYAAMLIAIDRAKLLTQWALDRKHTDRDRRRYTRQALNVLRGIACD